MYFLTITLEEYPRRIWLWYSKTGDTSYELRVASGKLKSASWNSKVRVQIHKLRVRIHELRVQIHKLWVPIHELQVQIHELRVQLHVLRVQNIELQELQKVLFSLLSECWTSASHEGFEKSFPQHDLEKTSLTIILPSYCSSWETFRSIDSNKT